MAFGDYQLEIYLQGLSGIVPTLAIAGLKRTVGRAAVKGEL